MNIPKSATSETIKAALTDRATEIRTLAETLEIDLESTIDESDGNRLSVAMFRISTTYQLLGEIAAELANELSERSP